MSKPHVQMNSHRLELITNGVYASGLNPTRLTSRIIYIGEVMETPDKNKFIAHGTGEYISDNLYLRGNFQHGEFKSGCSSTWSGSCICYGQVVDGRLDDLHCMMFSECIWVGMFHLGKFVRGSVYDPDGQLVKTEDKIAGNCYIYRMDENCVHLDNI